MALLILSFLFLSDIQAEKYDYLWDELQVAMDNKSEDLLELQAFERQINSEKKDPNQFIEQPLTTSMAGTKKPMIKPRSNYHRENSRKMPTRLLKRKRRFKAPRNRSR